MTAIKKTRTIKSRTRTNKAKTAKRKTSKRVAKKPAISRRTTAKKALARKTKKTTSKRKTTTKNKTKAKVTSIFSRLSAKRKTSKKSKAKAKSKLRTNNVRSLASARTRKLKKSSALTGRKAANSSTITSMFNNVVNSVLVDIKRIPFTQFTKNRERERQELVQELKNKKRACVLAVKLMREINKGSCSILRILQKQKGLNKGLPKECSKFKTSLSKVLGHHDHAELKFFDLQTLAGIFGEIVLVMHGSCKNIDKYNTTLSQKNFTKLKQEIHCVNRKIKSYLNTNDRYIPSNVAAALSTVNGLVQTALIGVKEKKAS